MTEANPSVTQPKNGRGWRWLLVVSLALNLLVAGAVAGLWIKGPPHGAPHWGATPTTFGLMRFSRDLPLERRQKVRGHLREAYKSLRPLRDEMRAARRRAAEALGAPDFSKEKLQAAMDGIGAAETRIRQTGVDALIKGIGELEPVERQKLSEAWLQRLDREYRPRRRHKNDESGMGGPSDDQRGSP